MNNYYEFYINNNSLNEVEFTVDFSGSEYIAVSINPNYLN